MATNNVTPFPTALGDEAQKPKLRLLVVDDEPDLCDLMAASLQAVSDCEVVTALDATSALEAISNQDIPFDGIFLDIQMPCTTGIDLCAIVRRTPGYDDVPIIMLTAMAERRFLHAAYVNGADDYITKPFELNEVRKTLSKERWQRQRRGHLKAGRASYGSDATTRSREVINALEDAVLLPDIPRCIRRDAFQNYLLQAKARPGVALTLRAIKVTAIHDIFSRLSSSEYQALMDDFARAISQLTETSDDVITHLGNGIFLTACEGRSALTKDALQDAMQAAGLPERLEEFELKLHAILGEDIAVTDGPNSDVLFLISRAIDTAEAVEENLSGWATFREWLSFRKSTGRERARVEQSAYEQILNDFIAEGELDWKKATTPR